jgi:predicted DNA-binding transcriptional regulator YafY
MAQKKDVDASPSEKVVGLYGLLLFTGRKYSLTELADKFRCSKQTVLRMVETIERTHTLRLVSEIENGSRLFWVEAPKQRPNVSLQAEDVRYLTLCKEMVANLLPDGIRGELERTVEVVTSLVAERSKAPSKGQSLGMATSKGTIDYGPYQAVVDILLNAKESNAVCIVTYNKPSGEVAEYHFAPDKLHARNSVLYAEGWRVTDRGTPEVEYEQTLAIHRIENITPTRRHFDFDDERTIEPYFGFGFSDPFQVKVEFKQSVASYISERKWSAEQSLEKRPDGSVVLEFTAQSYPEVVSWVLGFGDNAELLEPVEMRQELLNIASSLVKRYC